MENEEIKWKQSNIIVLNHYEIFLERMKGIKEKSQPGGSKKEIEKQIENAENKIEKYRKLIEKA